MRTLVCVYKLDACSLPFLLAFVNQEIDYSGSRAAGHHYLVVMLVS
jgi:hypothetical protein